MLIEIAVFKRFIQGNSEPLYFANNYEQENYQDQLFSISEEKSISELVMMILLKLRESKFSKSGFEISFETIKPIIQGDAEEKPAFVKKLSEEEQDIFWKIFQENFQPNKD